MLVCFCGADGSGKSTYINALEKSLIEVNKPTTIIDPMKNGILTFELNKFKKTCDVDKQLSTYMSTIKSTSYALDMLYYMKNLSATLTLQDKIVISHRYDICCKVYGDLSGANINYIEMICNNLPKPDLYIYMHVDAEIAVERIYRRGTEKTWKENLSTIEKAMSKYELYLNDVPIDKLLIINNNMQLGSINNNLDIIQKKVIRLGM